MYLFIFPCPVANRSGKCNTAWKNKHISEEGNYTFLDATIKFGEDI